MSKVWQKRFTRRKKKHCLGDILIGLLNSLISGNKPAKMREAGQVGGPRECLKTLLNATKASIIAFGAYAQSMSTEKEISFIYARMILNRIQSDLESVGFDDAEWQSFSEGYEMYIGGVCVARGVDPDPATAAEDLIDNLAYLFSQAPKA